MSEDRFEEFLRKAAAEVRRPPATPQDEIWARIEDARRTRGAGRLTPEAQRIWRWGLGLAAMLLLGIGLGRLPIWKGGTPGEPPAAASGRGDAVSAAYRLAAVQTLSQADALLTSLRAGDVDPQVAAWARDVLTTTRLLLDSPAGADRQMRSLLQDLELVLVQIVQLEGDGEQLDWIRKGMEESGVLPRIRSAIPPGAVMTMGT